MIGGAQYDQVDRALEAFSRSHGVDIQVEFRGDHVALNDHLATALPGGAAYDLVSTHSKYAPSQARRLQSLDEVLGSSELTVLQPGALSLCRVGGVLRCVPRNIDARLLFVNRAVVDDAWLPTSWPHLLDSLADVSARSGLACFAFPTRDSGLFGTFYELTAALGGHLFDEDGEADFTAAVAIAALEWLVDAGTSSRIAPRGMIDDAWYFDEISAAFRCGGVAVVGDWPGYYGLLAAQPGALERTRILRYPPGVNGARHVYAGCHAWAIPADAPDLSASLSLLRHLVGTESAEADAATGMVPVRTDVSMPVNHPLDVERAELLRLTVTGDLLTFPPLEDYPAIEQAAAVMLRAALVGECSPRRALDLVLR